MCTLFNQLSTTQAMIDLRAEFERLNIPPLYGIYPDYVTNPGILDPHGPAPRILRLD